MKISTLGRELLQQNENRFHLRIRRSHALTDAIELIELATEKEMLSKLKVTFLGEAGVDDGGLTRELCSLIVDQASSSYMINGMDICNGSVVLPCYTFYNRSSYIEGHYFSI